MAKGSTAPFSRHEWMLSLRYLRARRKEGFISVIAGFSFLGIVLGVATLIIVMAVMNGFRGQLLDKILGVNGHLIVEGIGRNIDDYDEVAAKLRALKGVVRAVPYVEGQVMASTNGRSAGALIRGMREADLKDFKAIAGKVRTGTLDGFDDSDGVAVGSRLAVRLGLGVGSKLTLISPNGPATPFGIAPQIRSYPVIAVFEIGMSEYDSTFVFMPFKVAQSYFKVGNSANAIEVMVKDPEKVDDLRDGALAAASADTNVTTWQQRNATFFNALQVERNVMFLILTLIVLVAALNIVSGLIMLVKDKGRDIAILRSMGATRGSIMRVFLITGAAIGFVGTLFGFLIGVVFCLNIENIRQFISSLTGTELFSPELYYLSRLPADMDMFETATVVVMALFLSFLATLYPSWRAARLDPVAALRYE